MHQPHLLLPSPFVNTAARRLRGNPTQNRSVRRSDASDGKQLCYSVGLFTHHRKSPTEMATHSYANRRRCGVVRRRSLCLIGEFSDTRFTSALTTAASRSSHPTHSIGREPCEYRTRAYHYGYTRCTTVFANGGIRHSSRTRRYRSSSDPSRHSSTAACNRPDDTNSRHIRHFYHTDPARCTYTTTDRCCIGSGADGMCYNRVRSSDANPSRPFDTSCFND